MFSHRTALAISFIVVILLATDTYTPQRSALSSPFRLPALPGVTLTVTQGNGDGKGVIDHTQANGSFYAFDFKVSTTNFVVTAAQGGTVIGADDSSTIGCDASSCWKQANYVVVANDDGITAALYLHLLPHSLKVHSGTHVNQGDPLGQADTTGWATGPHLHFQVEDIPSVPAQPQQSPGWWWTNSRRVTFSNSEVLAQDADGIPRTDQSFVVSNPPQSTPVSTTPTPLCSTPPGTNYFDDFSSYAPGQPPSGYILRGASGVNPTIEEVGGTGPAYRLLDFPAVSNQYWDRWVLKAGLTLCTSYIVTVKLNFQTSGDRAGLAIAWNDANLDRLDIQPNIYFQNIEFRITYTGSSPTSPSVTGPALNRYSLPMNIGSDYWLRVVATSPGPGQGQVIVYWSTDGTNFTPAVTATGLASITGLVGMSTSGPNLPNVYFDDFQAHEN